MKTKKVRKLMALIMATAMLFAVAMPVSATAIAEEEGCGFQIMLVETRPQGGWNCGTSGGVSGCISGVNIELYSCFTFCKPGYNGYRYRCNAGHIFGTSGQISGFC